MMQTRPTLRRLAMLATLTIAVAIAVLSLMPSGTATPVPGNDKMHHFIAYAALALPMTLWLGRQAVWRVFAITLAYGAVMEFAQWLAPTGREASLLDIFADAIGAGFGTGLGVAVIRLMSRN